MDLNTLALKIPLIERWIDETLASHADKARPVSESGFTRLPLFYSKDLLTRTKVIALARVPVPPLTELGLTEFSAFENGNYGGITYKDCFFVQESAVMNESLYFHELVHIVQWAHLGVERFLLAYAAGLVSHGYRDSPLEVMAYSLQDYFDRNGQPTDVEAFVRTKLSEGL